MKTFDEIKKDSRVTIQSVYPNGLSGYLFLRGKQGRMLTFVCSIEKVKQRLWEHVRISTWVDTDSVPSLSELNEVKCIFWRRNEAAELIFPNREDMVHHSGFCKDETKQSVSLWRQTYQKWLDEEVDVVKMIA